MDRSTAKSLLLAVVIFVIAPLVMAQTFFGVVRNPFAANTTFYVNGNSAATANCNGQTCQPGSDSNDGRSTATPFLTSQHALNVVENTFDPVGFTPTIQLSDAAAASAAAANYHATCQGLSALGTIVGITVNGNTTTPLNVNITSPNGGYGISANDFCVIFLNNVQINDAGTAKGAVRGVEFGIVDTINITTGTFNSAATIYTADGGNINFAGTTITVGGGAGQLFLTEHGGRINGKNSGVVNIPSAVAFTTIAVGQSNGRFEGFSSSTFSGSGVSGTTGIRAALSTGATAELGGSSINTVFPGNSPATITTGANDDFGDPLTTPCVVASGCTGNATAAAHSVPISEGTSPQNAATTGTGGQLFLDQGSGSDPAFEPMSGDATIAANGALTVGANKITNGKLAVGATNTVKCSLNGTTETDCTTSQIQGVVSSWALKFSAAGINFNQPNGTDVVSFAVGLPVGSTGFAIQRLEIFNCTASITSMHFGMFDGALATGNTLISNTTGTNTTPGPATVASLQATAPSAGTDWYNSATLYLNQITQEGSAVTCNVTLWLSLL